MADDDSPTAERRSSERLLSLLGVPAPAWTAEQEAAYQADMAHADGELHELTLRRDRGQHAA